MKAALVLCCLALLGTSVAEVSQVTPVQKVLGLLNGMLEKGKEEKHQEEVRFAAYHQFCDSTAAEKKRAIQQADEVIDMATADIQKYSATVEQLAKEIAGLDEDISVWQGDIRAATKVREIEQGDYDETHKDYSESIDAVKRAVQVLKNQAHDRKQKGSFTQVATLKELKRVPADAKRTIAAFLEEGNDSTGAPEANAYEFQSQGVVDLLEKLLDKFIDERTTLENEETNSRHAYEMLMQDLQSQVAQGKEDRGLKAKAKSKKLQAKADSTGDLEDTTSSKAADTTYLEDLLATCSLKSADFEKRQTLRAEEIKAIKKAIEIISSGAVAGNAQKHSFIVERMRMRMRDQAVALPQLRSSLNSQNQQQVAAYLNSQATKLNSRVLASVAVHVTSDPFSKVKRMIKEMITKLMEEAAEETEHKGWCDTELATNGQTRKDKTQAVEMLHAEIDQLEASLAQLSDDIAELSKAVADLDAAMTKATAIRMEEKAKNAETMSDAQAAQTAVAKALTVLNEFYAKAADATSFLQQPETFDSEYKGMQGESGGVVGMLEVIESDFARLAGDTDSAEDSSQREYDEFMNDSKMDKAEKSKDLEHKTAKQQDQSQALLEKKSDLEGTQKELDTSLAYFDKLKPTCVDTGVSYEDRVSRRKEEIASLQDALRILNGENI